MTSSNPRVLGKIIIDRLNATQCRGLQLNAKKRIKSAAKVNKSETFFEVKNSEKLYLGLCVKWCAIRK